MKEDDEQEEISASRKQTATIFIAASDVIFCFRHFVRLYEKAQKERQRRPKTNCT